MTQAEYRRKRRHYRHHSKRRIALAYIVRASIALAFVGIVVLMGCGFLYVRDLLSGDKQETVSNQNLHNQDAATIEILDINKQEVASNAGAVFGAEVIGEDSSLNDTEKTDTKKDLGKDETEEEGWTVVLDAGHGGKDVGTEVGKVYEKNINLSVVKLMQEILEEQGVNVVMTRDTDVFLQLQERVDIANEEAADLFVSIHCNSYEDDSSIKGLECYYPEGSEPGEEYAKYLMEVIKQCKDISSRSYREETYYVTEHTEAPAILVEMGFMTNASECKKLNSASYQQTLAEELSAGILRGLEKIAEEEEAAEDGASEQDETSKDNTAKDSTLKKTGS